MGVDIISVVYIVNIERYWHQHMYCTCRWIASVLVLFYLASVQQQSYIHVGCGLTSCSVRSSFCHFSDCLIGFIAILLLTCSIFFSGYFAVIIQPVLAADCCYFNCITVTVGVE